MFNKTKIADCFTSLVGWRESSKAPSCYPNLSVELTTSNSGLYVSDVPAMNLELISSVIGVDEVDINTYLGQQHANASLELINQFVIAQKETLKTKSLLEDFSIGTRFGNIRELEVKRDRFVGFEIKPSASNNIKATIKSVGIQFSEVEALDIYFYSSSSKEPLKVFNLVNTKQLTLEWFALEDFVADYISENLGAGDCYYLGYYESEMIGQAVETDLPCSTCGNSPYKKYSPYISIKAIEVSAGSTYVSREIFDVEDVGYTDSTFGLHLRIDAKCDISTVICDNKEMFADVIRKKIAINLFWEAYNSTKINRVALITKEDSRLNAEKLEMDLEKELKTISMDFSQIDAVCLPCKRRAISMMTLG